MHPGRFSYERNTVELFGGNNSSKTVFQWPNTRILGDVLKKHWRSIELDLYRFNVTWLKTPVHQAILKYVILQNIFACNQYLL